MEEINIKEEVYKCSKCGLCQSVCPIFLALKNEMYLSRGRYNILNNFFNNNKPLSKKFINDLDICLNCNACKNFCPSAIDSALIFTLLKNKYYRPLFPFWLKFKLILIFNSIKKYFAKQPLYKITVQKSKNYAPVKKADVVYFQGCFNRYINPSDKNSALNILKQNGYNTVKVLNNCCGLPFLSDGSLKKFEKNSLKILKAIPKNVKYAVTSCDSCYKTLYDIFKTSDIELIKLEDLIPNTGKTENTVFHKPFALEQYKGILPVINKKGICSLTENYFMFKHPDIAGKILENVFYTQEELKEKTIVTSCNLTKWGLIECCKKKGINAEIYSLAEYYVQTN